MPIFGLHAWLKNRPRLPVLEASIIGIKVRRLGSFSLDWFYIHRNRGQPKGITYFRGVKNISKPNLLYRGCIDGITGPEVS